MIAGDLPLRAALAADPDLPVSTLPQLETLSAAVRTQRRAARLHLKVGTGVSRGGTIVEELPTLTAALRRAEDGGTVDVVGLRSHLSHVDEPASGFTEEHLERHRQAKQVVLAADLSPSTHHLVAIGGPLWRPQACMDLVYTGTSMYGLSPNPSVAIGAGLGLRPAIRLESSLV